MKKPTELRQYLEAGIPSLRQDPDKLHIFIEDGAIVSRPGGGMSYMYRYKLAIVITDYTDHADTVAIPILAWVAENQPELLQNPDTQNAAIAFEAEIIDHEKSDIQVTLNLTESVVVSVTADGYRAEHLAEPALPDLTGPTGWEIYVNGTPIDQL